MILEDIANVQTNMESRLMEGVITGVDIIV